jgi:hypothetical protein
MELAHPFGLQSYGSRMVIFLVLQPRTLFPIGGSGWQFFANELCVLRI